MRLNQLHWLDIAEFVFIGITLISLVIGIALNSLIYPLVSLTIALCLNFINRLRFQYRYRKNFNKTIKQVQRQFSEDIQELSEKVSPPPTPPAPPSISDSSAITIFQENLMTLEESLNTIIHYLNNHALRERIEQLEINFTQFKQSLSQDNSSTIPKVSDNLTVAIPDLKSSPQPSNPIPDVNLPPLSKEVIAPSWNCIYTLSDHTEAVASLSMSSDGKILVSGSWDRSLKVWEVATGHLLTTVEAHSQGILTIVFTGDQSSSYSLASGSFDQSLKFWSLHSQEKKQWKLELQQLLTAHTGSIHALACATNNNLLVSGSYDKTLKQWNLETGEMLASSLDSLGAIYAVALAPQNRLIASAGGDGKVILWEIGMGHQLGLLKGNVSSVESLAISADELILAAGCVDGTIKLWQLETSMLESKKQPQPIRILSAHRGQVHALLFSQEEQLLFSSGSDGLIKIWHPGSQEAIATFGLNDRPSTHANAVFSLALSSDGQFLAAGGMDGTIKVWKRDRG